MGSNTTGSTSNTTGSTSPANWLSVRAYCASTAELCGAEIDFFSWLPTHKSSWMVECSPETNDRLDWRAFGKQVSENIVLSARTSKRVRGEGSIGRERTWPIRSSRSSLCTYVHGECINKCMSGNAGVRSKIKLLKYYYKWPTGDPQIIILKSTLGLPDA